MKYSKENLTIIVDSSNNYSDVVRKFGLNPTYGNRQTLKKYIDIFEINTNHFRRPINRKSNKKLDFDYVFIENSKTDRSTVKKIILKNSLKEYKCEICGQDENWLGKKMSLILGHKNGINNDNRIENLRFVCPNCNATLETHGGKNIKRKYVSDVEKKHCKCGVVINRESNLCEKCSHIKQRKVERPPYPNLIDEIEKLGYVGVGKKYSVSDNAIRNWKKSYENDFKK